MTRAPGGGTVADVTELNGRLEGIGLVALVRFLASIARTGRLLVVDGSLHGWLDLQDGSVVGAGFDQEQGLPALEAIALALGRGRFEFADAEASPAEHNLRLGADELEQRLEQLAGEQVVLAAAIPSLSGVAHLQVDAGSADEQVPLDRDTLRLLIRLDGRRTVAELARERGLLRTLRQLARLVQFDLVRVEVPAAASPPKAARPAEAAPVEADTHGSVDREAEAPTSAEPRARPTTGEPAWSRWRRPTNPS